MMITHQHNAGNVPQMLQYSWIHVIDFCSLINYAGYAPNYRGSRFSVAPMSFTGGILPDYCQIQQFCEVILNERVPIWWGHLTLRVIKRIVSRGEADVVLSVSVLVILYDYARITI